MSVDIQTDSSFSGTKRQKFIHYRLFTLLSGYDGHYTRRSGWEDNYTEEEMVFSWFTDINGWEEIEIDLDGWLFVSLARALPGVGFSYVTHMTDETGSSDWISNEISYTDGTFRFRSKFFEGGDLRYLAECPHCRAKLTLNGDEVFEDTYECPKCGEQIILHTIMLAEEYENEDLDDENDYFRCKIDINGNIIGNEELLSECMEEEETMVTDSMEWELSLADLIEIGTDDPQQLMDLGMLYETGLAGLEKNPTLAWDYYLKAAETGDENAVKFVSEIFADESRAELYELLLNKSISRDAYPVLFDLAQKENSAELTAELLEYKNALGE